MLPLLTVVTAALVVVALVAWLTPTLLALYRARRNVAAIADGLEVVRDRTAPLAGKLAAVNGGLGAVACGLQRADSHLGKAAAAFGIDT